MKKLVKIISFSLFVLLSMYTTSLKIENYRSKDEIMIKIKETEEKYNISPVNAEIKDEYIIPGHIGRKININKSYSKMKKYGNYNEALTIIDEVTPTISINNIYDKYIEKTSNTRNISLIILLNKDNIQELLNLLKNKNIKLTIFIDGTYLEKNKQNILKLTTQELEIKSYNNEYNNVFMKSSISYLNSLTKTKSSFCFTDKDNKELLNFCANEKMHTIKTNIINKYLFQTIKNNINTKNIFALQNIDINELALSIEYIQKKGYRIVTLKELITENN